MPLTKVVVEKLKHEGGKTHWELKASDLEMIGGEPYLKLPRQGVQQGFTRLCIEEDGAVPNTSKCFSLMTSRGYRRIMQQRNLAQAESLMDDEAHKVPELFKSVAPKEVKKPKTSRSKLRELKDHPDVITITIADSTGGNAFPLKVKRPLRDHDDLVVQYDMDVIDKIIGCIRAEGYEESLKPPALPKGVHRRLDCKYHFQYCFTNEAGKTSKHYASSLEAAIVGVQEGPPAPSSGGQCEDSASLGRDGEEVESGEIEGTPIDESSGSESVEYISEE